MAVDNSNLVSLFSDIADAIRSKTGSASTIVADAFPSAIAAIPTGGEISGTYSITSNGTYNVASYASVDVDTGTDNSMFYNLIESRMTVTFPIFTDSTITSLRKNAFAFTHIQHFSLSNCVSLDVGAFWGAELKTASLPKITSIPQDTFLCCPYLSSVYAPSVTAIGSGAFRSCYSLTTVEFSLCTYLHPTAFNQTGLTSILSTTFPELKSVEMSGFASCSNLSIVDLPKVTYLRDYAFYTCSSLTSVNLPAVTNSMSGNTFAYCTNLTNFSASKLTVLWGSTFHSCINLSTVSFPSLQKISGNSAFSNCYNLLSLYLMGSSMATLTAANTFGGTPISNRTTSTGGVYGSIYVPSSLYSSYIAATNWVTYSARFVSV